MGGINSKNKQILLFRLMYDTLEKKKYIENIFLKHEFPAAADQKELYGHF